MTNRETDLPGTKVVHADVQSRAGAIVAPIFQASTFAARTNDEFLEMANEKFSDEFYIRYGTPNHTQVAEVVAALEGAERAVVTASGMGAISTLVFSLLKQGDHVVIQQSTYPGTLSLVTSLLARFGVTASLVNQTNPHDLADAMRSETRLVLLESPSNPLLGITNIAASVEIAHSNESLVVVDNTIATPINQKPLDMGADLVWHSATKYLGGHSDVSAGILAGRHDLVEQIWRTHLEIGSVLGPFDAWLLLRGLRTLDVRMARHNENGLALANALEQHPEVCEVHYPGLATHPQHELAARQMTGFSGLLSFIPEGGASRADQLLDALQLTTRAASLGSVQSIATRPSAMWSGHHYNDHGDSQVGEGLIRLSLGIEAKEDLLKDLEQALHSTAQSNK